MDNMANKYTIGNDYGTYDNINTGNASSNDMGVAPLISQGLIENYPYKTPCSIMYNKYEIEIFATFDDQPKCFLFWLVILLFLIAFFPIFLIAFILQNTKCPRYMISRVYIYKKGNQIVIKRKGNNSCYCLYCASHSYFDANNVNRFDTEFYKGTYLFKLVENNGNEDTILPISNINQEIRDLIINYLNALIVSPYSK